MYKENQMQYFMYNHILVIYFESEANRDLYREDPTEHKLEHYEAHSGKLDN